jgi:hypothetical protein
MFRRAELAAIANRLIGGSAAVLTRKTDIRNLKRLIALVSPVATDKQLVRFGPGGDGGYLIPNDLQGVEACFSPGREPHFGLREAMRGCGYGCLSR